MVREALRGSFEPGAAQARSASRVGTHQRGPPLKAYLDSSALVKAFLEEVGREVVVALLDEATVAGSPLGYVECHSAFSRLFREGHLDESSVREARNELDARWVDVASVELDDALRLAAGELTNAHVLRGSDAVHLASAFEFAGGTSSDVRFACWDQRLWDAARASGFQMIPAARP